VRVEITDNGPGIDAEKIRKVWLPYITFNKKNGTGLGLPVVKRLVETLGGTVDLVSPAGSGVCVIMELPAKIPQKEVE
jgi:two-component system, sporulation sensor kinase D